MKTAVLLLASGNVQYLQSAKALIKSLREFFPPCDIILFTDSQDEFDAIKVYQSELGWPRISLMRFHMMLKSRELLSQYDQIFYLDTDMLVCSKIEGDEIFSTGITAVLHSGYITDFDRNPLSTAYVSGDPPYYQACLFGGDTKEVLKMCEVLAHNIDVDDSKGIVARYYDESHLNRYLFDHPPAKVLTPAYCFPALYLLRQTERWLTTDPKIFVPKIRHLGADKKAQNWKDPWDIITTGHPVLIAIASCHSLRSLENTQRETWIKDIPGGVDYKFFLGNPNTKNAQADEIFLDTPDEYMSFEIKANSIFKWTLEHGYQYLYRCDLDTLVNVKNLLSSDFKQYDYVGGAYNQYIPPAEGTFASGGPGYCLSRRALHIVADTTPRPNCNLEDQAVGWALRQAGIILHEDTRYKFLPGSTPDKEMIGFHLSSCFGWGAKYQPAKMISMYREMKNKTLTTEEKTAPGVHAVWRDGRVVYTDAKGKILS